MFQKVIEVVIGSSTTRNDNIWKLTLACGHKVEAPRNNNRRPAPPAPTKKDCKQCDDNAEILERISIAEERLNDYLSEAAQVGLKLAGEALADEKLVFSPLRVKIRILKPAIGRNGLEM